jgi:hypothetical protein
MMVAMSSGRVRKGRRKGRKVKKVRRRAHFEEALERACMVSHARVEPAKVIAV